MLPLRPTADSVLTAATSQDEGPARRHSSDLFGREIICHRDQPSEMFARSAGGSRWREMNWKQWTRQGAAASPAPYVCVAYMHRHFRADEADS